MKITVLLPSRDVSLIEKIKSLMNPDDVILPFDCPRFPARRIDEMIWRQIPNENTLVVLMNPNTIDMELDFLEAFRAFQNSVSDVFIRSPLEQLEEFTPEKSPKGIRSTDCVSFYRSVYRRQLSDISPHADFTTCIREIVRSCGKGTYYTPPRTLPKAEVVNTGALINRLEDIKERKRLREEERSRMVEKISRLRYEKERGLLDEKGKKKLDELTEADSFQKRKQKEAEVKLREDVARSVAKKRRIEATPVKRSSRAYLQDDPQTRKMVLSEIPKTKEKLAKVTLIDWE